MSQNVLPLEGVGEPATHVADGPQVSGREPKCHPKAEKKVKLVTEDIVNKGLEKRMWHWCDQKAGLESQNWQLPNRMGRDYSRLLRTS